MTLRFGLLSFLMVFSQALYAENSNFTKGTRVYSDALAMSGEVVEVDTHSIKILFDNSDKIFVVEEAKFGELEFAVPQWVLENRVLTRDVHWSNEKDTEIVTEIFSRGTVRTEVTVDSTKLTKFRTHLPGTPFINIGISLKPAPRAAPFFDGSTGLSLDDHGDIDSYRLSYDKTISVYDNQTVLISNSLSSAQSYFVEVSGFPLRISHTRTFLAIADPSDRVQVFDLHTGKRAANFPPRMYIDPLTQERSQVLSRFYFAGASFALRYSDILKVYGARDFLPSPASCFSTLKERGNPAALDPPRL